MSGPIRRKDIWAAACRVLQELASSNPDWDAIADAGFAISSGVQRERHDQLGSDESDGRPETTGASGASATGPEMTDRLRADGGDKR